MFYSMASSDIEDLIICASHDNAHYIPQSLCKTYLFNHRGTPEDIQYLESHSGLSFVFGLRNEKDKLQMLDFLVSKKIDINKISAIDGMAPLHAAVMDNNVDLVKKLLQYGADKSVISPTLNATPLQLAIKLQEKKQGDLSKIIELLNS